MKRLRALCIGSFLLAIGLFAGPSWAELAGLPAFEMHAVHVNALVGQVEGLAPDFSVSLRAAELVRVPGDELISLRRRGTRLPGWPKGEHIVCVNGDRLAGKVLRLQDERLHIAADIGAGLELGFAATALSYVWLAAPDGIDDVEMLQQRLQRESRSRDVVMLRNGDVIEGTLLALTAETLRMDADGKAVEIERPKAALIAFNTELARAARARSTYAHLVLANGSRLSVGAAQADGKTLTAKTLNGGTVRVPLNQLVALDVRQGRAVYLSELKPRSFEHKPYLGLAWPWQADCSVVGRPLYLGGSTFDKGLGMHSESRLTYDLLGRYRRFEALVGLDGHSGREGNVRIQVMVDGKSQSLGWNGTLQGRETPRSLRIATEGARQLTLGVLYGRRGDVQDHVDWADARLIK